MKKIPFKSSQLVSIGTELEFQIVNPYTQNLVSRAKDLIRNIKASQYTELIKPEITQSMIEINSSVHSSPREMLKELVKIRNFLMEQSKDIGICICGGGTHPYQNWSLRKIFPSQRFKDLSRQYRYLSKRATVFGQHVHVGCQSGDDAIYLTHAMARYVPHFIALSASSPFYEGVDSGYDSSRSTIFNAFPLSGVMPYFVDWQQFSIYFNKMRSWGIIKSMKDFYWDIRPKPEFGTIEIRVCDVPLTIKKAILLTAYIQTLALYLLTERPLLLSPELYYLYNYNRFQAARYGFAGDFVHPVTFKHGLIADDIINTLPLLEKYALRLKNKNYLMQLKEIVFHKENDAAILRNWFCQMGSLHEVVKEQCVLWGA